MVHGSQGGASICCMSIGEAVLRIFPYDTEMMTPRTKGKEAPGNGVGRRYGNGISHYHGNRIFWDAKGVMTFSDEIYRNRKSVLVSFLWMGSRVYESGEGGQGTQL